MKHIICILICTIVLCAETISFASSTETTSLPKPKLDGGIPLYEALKKRATGRAFSTKDISDKQLSQILWAATGVNCEKSQKRTAPTAWGNNEITLYVLLKTGTYIYNPIKHNLVTISKKDNRALGGIQKFTKDAPVTIVMVADLDKISQTKDEAYKMAVSQMDAGFISQNIYLAAVSEGLITGARAYTNKDKLRTALKLTKNQKIILANSLGYIKK